MTRFIFLTFVLLGFSAHADEYGVTHFCGPFQLHSRNSNENHVDLVVDLSVPGAYGTPAYDMNKRVRVEEQQGQFRYVELKPFNLPAGVQVNQSIYESDSFTVTFSNDLNAGLPAEVIAKATGAVAHCKARDAL